MTNSAKVDSMHYGLIRLKSTKDTLPDSMMKKTPNSRDDCERRLGDGPVDEGVFRTDGSE